MRRFLHLTMLGGIAFCLFACTKLNGPATGQLTVRPGQDLTALVNLRTDCATFLLLPGSYSAAGGQAIRRSNITIRRLDTTGEVRITEPMQIWGSNNVVDGLTWDGDIDKAVRSSDPGTLAIGGSSNIIRHCVFKNMRMPVHGTTIIYLGRVEQDHGQFRNTAAGNNIIESCTFQRWGLYDEAKGSTKSSTCISVGEEDEKGKFTGTIIRNNKFLDGPYKQYGYNAAIKVFNPVQIESNLFYGGQECLEVKYGNSAFRSNIIHHFSGYNILANRSGKNNIYENNIVHDIRPADKVSSAQGFMIWEAGNTVYRNNVIYDCAQTGLILGRQTSTSPLLEYVLIENNSFIGNSSGIHFNNQQGSPRHVFVTKNIFYGLQRLPVVYMLSGWDRASIEYYSANVYYNNTYAEGDDEPLKQDPAFTDAAANNYALQPGSPACGYGAIPCSIIASGYKTINLSPNLIIYPTRKKHRFHVGLAGTDAIPVRMNISDATGRVLLERNFDDVSPAGLHVVANVDVSGIASGAYTLKVFTTTGSFTRQMMSPSR